MLVEKIRINSSVSYTNGSTAGALSKGTRWISRSHRRAVDVPDFVENGQAQVFTDPRHALQQRIVAAGDFFGLSLEFLFQGEDLLIEMANHGQVVFQSDLAQGIVFGPQQLFLPGIARAPGLPGREGGCGPVDGSGCEPAILNGARRRRCADAAVHAAAVCPPDRRRPVGSGWNAAGA